MVRDRYASEIAAGIELDDWGEPTPVCGYWFGAITRDTPRNRSFAVLCNAGATFEVGFPQPRKTLDFLFGRSSTGCGCHRLSGLSSRAAGPL